MWRHAFAMLTLLVWGWLGATTVAAQDEILTLYLRRNFGYGGGSQIQGSFRLEVDGPSDLVSVTYKIDEQVVSTTVTAPFRVDFSTGDYPPGWHDFTATGQTATGSLVVAAARRFEILSAAQAAEATQGIIGPAFGIAGGLILLIVVISVVSFLAEQRNGPLPLGAPRRYGLFGGAICPKCQRPFSIHWWALNAVAGRFDRCPHCGQWSLVRAQSHEKLAAAEAAEVPSAPTVKPAISPAEKLRQQIDESRYQN